MSDRPVLLTVSGEVPDGLDADVAAGRRPRADYRVLADAFDADVLDVTAALAESGRAGRLLHRLGGAGALLAWCCFRRRRRHEVIVTDGEQVGLPLALLERFAGRRHARHVMIVHVLSTRSKESLVRAFRLAGLIDRYVVYATSQADVARARLGVPAERVVLTPFMVDTEFFDPAAVDVERRRLVVSAGLERRDYPTMMAAVRDLDVEVVVAAASPWSRRDDSTEGADVPANVTVRRLDLFELRATYAAARFVVMPLEPVDFQAGITTILEAMSMGLAIVCTRTPGQTDTVVDGVTGTYVEPDDAGAMRRAVEALLDDPALARRWGEAARAWAIEHAEVDVYARRLAAVVAEVRAELDG